MEIDNRSKLLLNAIINGIRGITGVIFPFLTFPYISRTLGVEQLGRFNFANSIISYFILIAALGVNAYAIRESALFREDRVRFGEFASEIFSINVIATIIAYLLLFCFIIISTKIRAYVSLVSILSITIILQTIGVDWIYTAKEEFIYIALRSFLCQILSLILMFTFVKEPKDVEIYALITVLSSGGANLLNFIRAKKFCTLKFVLNKKTWIHLKPILTLFVTSITIVIYVGSDTTMLGYMCGDKVVGLYTVSVKVYTVVKTIVSSLLVVFVPQIARLILEKKQEKLNLFTSEIFNGLITIVIPIIVGITCLSTDIILLISGNEYIKANNSLIILAVSLLFSMGSFFWGQCILIPHKKEKALFYITTLSAVCNIIFNLLLIPYLKQDGTAITTVIAEAATFFGSWAIGRKYIQIHNCLTTVLKSVAGALGIIGVAHLSKMYLSDYLVRLCISIPVSIIVYFAIEIIIQNKSVFGVIDMIKNRKVKRL